MFALDADGVGGGGEDLECHRVGLRNSAERDAGVGGVLGVGLLLDVRDIDRRGRELGDVDELGRFQIAVALLVAGLDAREVELDRRGAALKVLRNRCTDPILA